MRQALALALITFLMAACAHFRPGPTSPEPPSADVVAQGSTPQSSSTPQAQSTKIAPAPVAAKQTSPPSAVPVATAAGASGEVKKEGAIASKPKRPGAETPGDLPAASGSAGQTVRQAAAARISEKPVETAPEKPRVPATLDLASLEQRLRDTRAIGVFTKLSLKNQVDDLLGQFRAYHKKETQISLGELRERYDLLLLKVLTLLQDNDAPLTATISSSREAIWLILTDPGKFAKIDVQ
jgi:hypothetical protein